MATTGKRLIRKNFDAPEETRKFEAGKGHLELVRRLRQGLTAR